VVPGNIISRLSDDDPPRPSGVKSDHLPSLSPFFKTKMGIGEYPEIDYLGKGEIKE